MMSEFAKLFETDIGQILVLLEANEDDCPEIKILFKPDGFGVCKVKLHGFKDTDDSWERAEKGFQNTTQEIAYNVVSQTIQQIGLSND